MKILHTADWHMNNTLGRVDIGPHIVDALEQIAALLEEHRVDVMLVAGDLFSERSRPEQMARAVGQIKRIFGPFLERGGTMLAIAGNHDSEVFFETLRDAIKLATIGAANGSDVASRLHLTATPDFVKISDPSGVQVQFALLPYPTARCYLRGETASFHSIEEKHNRIKQGFTSMLRTIKTQRIDESLPAVLVSHVHVGGAQAHTLYKISETDDVVFDAVEIPSEWAYAAYGHIHKPGPVHPNFEHIRYSGSIARLDAAERDDIKSVVLFEVGPSGRIGEPEVIPLRCVPFYQIEITDPDVEVPTLAARFPDAERALVHYTLHYQPGKHNFEAIARDIERVFPFWYGRTLQKQNSTLRLVPSAPAMTNDSNSAPAHDVPGVVRRFLDGRLQEHADRDAVLGLAESLLAEEGWR